MKPNRITLGTAFLAAITLFTTSPRAPAQTGPGYALAFDGVTNYVAVNAQNVPIGNNNYTIEAWIKPNSMGNFGLIGWGNYGTTNQVNSFSLRTNGLVNSWWGNDLMLTNTGLAGAWHHVAATFDGTWRRLYLDGVLISSNSPVGHNVTIRTNLTIGRVHTNYFNGTIDEVRVWGEARNLAQIRTNRFIRLTGSESGLNAYWRFDEGAGTTAADAAGPWNPGTLVNNPAWVRSGATNAPEGVTSNATAITTASARLNARVHAGNLPARAWFQWGTTINYGTNTPQIAVGPGLPADPDALAFEVSSVLTNLAFNTTYYFRVAVTNNVGTNYGAQGTFTTLPLPTSPGCALSFNGTNSYVITPDLAAAFPNTNVTIELWFRANQPGVIVDERNTAGSWFNSQIEVVTTATNNACADVRVRVWPLSSPGITVGQVGYGTWNHIVLRYNRATTTLDGLLNGVPGLSATVTRQKPADLRYALGLGDSQHLGSGNFFDGEVDEFRLWNVVRSTAELQANLYRPLAGNEAGLVAYWRFDECSGTLANDATGHGYDGTLMNAPTWIASSVHYGPAIVTLPATNLTTTSALLKGSTHPQGFATTAWFQWGTTTNYANTTAITNAGSGTGPVALSTAITSLASPAAYHFRAVASNSYGVSYGANQSFWLGTPLVTTLPASAIVTNAATFNSSVIPSGPAGQAWFQWGLTTNYGNNTPLVGLASGSVPIVVTNRPTSLIPGATYHYRIVATNSFGTSVGEDVAFTTPFFAPLNVVLEGTDWSALAWGDYDNDGDLDILLTGIGPITKIYRNNNNGTFTELAAGLVNVAYGAVAWGDYDQDGDLDILLAGNTGSARVTRVYRNNGNSTFTDLAAALPGVANASAAWGDCDNDGDLDILLTGSTDGTASGAISRIYRNNGNSTFTDLAAGLPGVYSGSVAWGDYDNDGDLDILLTGLNVAGNPTTRVYRNNGNSTYSDLAAGLPGVYLSSVAWGDYDNDGDLDILLTGHTGVEPIARVYRNNGNGTFSDIGAGLPGVSMSAVAWGDFDSDGRLDILLTGTTGGDTAGAISRIYRNDGGNSFTGIPTAGLVDTFKGAVAVGDYRNDGRLDILITGWPYVTRLYHNYWPATNNPPTAPGNLTASVAGTNAVLTWTSATDPQTPGPGLSYNLRVGTTPGGSNVVPSHAAATGLRRVPQLGNRQQSLSANLAGLKYGSNYYWSVQAVDASFAGSPFATEGSFAVTLAPSAAAVQVGSIMGSSAALVASVYPNGAATTAYFQWGTTPSYGNSTAPVNVGSGVDPVSLRQSLTGLQPGTLYHFRVVTSNANGTTYGPDQTFYVDPAVVVGDVSGDGVVDQAELDAVLASYWINSPWLYMTNPAVLGGGYFQFALTNANNWDFSVIVSTNNVDWTDLAGRAYPVYQFLDPEATTHPARFYRLRWP